MPTVDLDLMKGESERTINALKIFWTKIHLLAFSQGLAMGNTDEERFAGTVIGDFAESIEQKISELDQLEEKKQFAADVVDSVLKEIHSYWQQNYLKFARACKDFR